MLNRRIVFALVGILVLLSLATPTLALPPRPTPPPAATSIPPAPPARTFGGWIELRVLNAKAQWTVVQWQDSAGKWIDIDSWRGAFDVVADGVGKKTWWVDQSSFGPTLFRWVIYDGASNQVLAQSQPFNLPTENKQTVSTQVSLAP